MRRAGALPDLPFRQLGDPLYSQRNPHQLFLLLLSVAAASQLWNGGAGSPDLDAAMAGWAVKVWGSGLLAGSLVALVGMWWPRTWTGLVVERTGLVVVAAVAALYAWVLGTAGSHLWYSVAIHTAYAASCAWRVAQITRRLRWVSAQVVRLNSRGDEA